MERPVKVYVVFRFTGLGQMEPEVAYEEKDGALRWLNNHGTGDHQLFEVEVEDLVMDEEDQ